MDVYTEFGADGIDAAAIIKKEHPEIKIIIVTGMPEVSYINRSLEAGVESFWYKEASKEEILDIMDRTMAGERIYPIKKPIAYIGKASVDQLTQRELDVLRGIVNGLSNQEIASEHFLAIDTVKKCVQGILQKTGLDNRTDLAVRAIESGLIIPRGMS